VKRRAFITLLGGRERKSYHAYRNARRSVITIKATINPNSASVRLWNLL